MAEILGVVASGITVAGLTKLCLEAFDIIQIARKQGQDYEKLSLRLNIERARLYIWSQAMGLKSHEAHSSTNKIHESLIEPLVMEMLNLILRSFQDGENLQSKYGCVISREDLDRKHLAKKVNSAGRRAIEKLADSFASFEISEKRRSQKSTLTSKTKWIIRDRSRFECLIQDVRSLIDGLQDITKSLSTASRQEGMMRYGIQQIKDTDTLELLSNVCQEDYPDLADAASVKVDVLSIATNQRIGIETWASSIGHDFDIYDNDDLEQLTITELKALLRHRQQIKSFNVQPITSSRQQSVMINARSYLAEVEIQYLPERLDVYKKFLGVIRGFKEKLFDTSGVIEKVCALFAGNPTLLRGFNNFLPPGYEIELGIGDDPDAIRIATPFVGTATSQSQNTTFLDVLLQAILQQARTSEERGPVDFSKAIEFVKKIKASTTSIERFGSRPDIYRQFLEILQAYQREAMPIQDIHSQVKNLFPNDPDLLWDFKQFLPDPATHAESIATSHKGGAMSSNARSKPATFAAVPQQIHTALLDEFNFLSSTGYLFLDYRILNVTATPCSINKDIALLRDPEADPSIDKPNRIGFNIHDKEIHTNETATLVQAVCSCE
ncbi:MAG: hypothetical protein Q9160_007333 [Pyrenula sp. 1 TL-2023]